MWTIWQRSSLGKRAPCQVGVVLPNWWYLAASPFATKKLHLEFRVHFLWHMHSCGQFATSADWEALAVLTLIG